MVQSEITVLMIGAIALGVVHGIEPGHGWPVAASYALDRTNKWLYGFAASFILGVGHLISSITMVGVFFYAKSYFKLTQINDDILLMDGLSFFGISAVYIGGPVSLVAGLLLIVLGLREYYGGGHTHDHGGGDAHSSGHDHDHRGHGLDHDHTGQADQSHPNTAVIPEGGWLNNDHSHDDEHDHSHDHGREDDHRHDHNHGHDHDHHEGGILSRLKSITPFVGGHSHSHGPFGEATDRGLLGIAWFAFLLGFAHEEEFEIIALCAGSNYCLELMSAYAITVIVGIVSLTMLLIAGYHQYEEKVKMYTPYLPLFSAIVLIIMGLGFITGLF